MLNIFIGGSFTGQGQETLDIYRHIKSKIKEIVSKVNVINPDDIDIFRENFKKINPQSTDLELDKAMVDFDLQFVKSCDIVIFDVTNRSIGVGMELGMLYKEEKPLLLVAKSGAVVSNMVLGAFNQGVKYYDNLEELDKILEDFFKGVNYAKQN